VKISCWIPTSESTFDVEKGAAISRGWGKLCDELVFINSATPGIRADWLEGYKHISEKSFIAWTYVHQKYGPQTDFFLKADTDTFVIGDNLRVYLQKFDSHLPHYIGKQLVTNYGLPFVGGTAIILSRGALNLFAEAAKQHRGNCTIQAFSAAGPEEDVAMARCMNDLGVYPHNTRDATGAELFMVFNPNFLNDSRTPLPEWYTYMSFNKEAGEACCSEMAIAFHHVSLDEQNNAHPERDKGLWKWTNNSFDKLS